MRKGSVIAAAAAILATGFGPEGLPGARSQEADVSAVVKGDNEFAFDLYGRLRHHDGNLFFSPNSISTALAMTYAGARGDTADEMARALHFTLPPEQLHPAFGALVRELNGAGRKRGYQLSVANALWGRKGYGFKDDFLRLARANYGGGLREVDFARNAEGARKEINSWVEKQTREKIKDLLKPSDVTPGTPLILTNAIYFKGDWLSPFKKEQTRDEPFAIGGGTRVTARMMHQTAKFRYHDSGTTQVLELPYAGKELSMVVLLPKAVEGLADLESSLTADRVAGWLSRLREQEVVVSLPRFQTTAEFRLRDQLSALGMRRAFTNADFSGITDKEGLSISDVIHKAFVDVNEEGTEAAAATAVISRGLSPSKQPVFRADHPFVFLIRDTRHGSVLFLGRVVNPTK